MSAEQELATPCGLYCGACTRYRAISDSTLAERVAQSKPYLSPLSNLFDEIQDFICEINSCSLSEVDAGETFF